MFQNSYEIYSKIKKKRLSKCNAHDNNDANKDVVVEKGSECLMLFKTNTVSRTNS